MTKDLDETGHLTYFGGRLNEYYRINPENDGGCSGSPKYRYPTMTAKPHNSRALLLDCAGRLFAEHGFDGVTTRMISREAGLRLSAIHYHFGNKENLYLEAFRQAHEKGNRVDFLEVLAENPELGRSPEGQAEVIRTTVLRYFRNIFNPKRPSWETKLLVREITTPSTALAALAETFMQSSVTRSEEFCKMVAPNIGATEAAVWADTLFSHAFFYLLARRPIELVRGEGWLTEEFFYNAARMVARFMILELELPLPDDLRKKHAHA